jgi:hypothetical protein
MSLQIIHHNKCDWNLPLKTDIFIFKFFHYLDGQFWAKVVAELIFKNKNEETKFTHQLILIALENTAVRELSSPAAETEEKSELIVPRFVLY